jgi:hypothetical protein
MKRAAIQRHSESSSDTSDSPPEADRKRLKCSSTSQETEVISGEVSNSSHQLDAASTTERTGEGSDKTYTFTFDTSAAFTGETGGAISPPTSSESVTPVAYISNSKCDGGTELVCRRARNRKRPAYRRRSERCSDISVNQPETERKSVKVTSTTEKRQSISEEVVISYPQPCAVSIVESVEAALPSASSQAVPPAAYMLDSSSDNTEIVCFPTKKRKRPAGRRDSDSSRGSSASPPEPHEERVLNRLHSYAERRSGVIDCLAQKPEVRAVQILNNSSRSQESEPDDHDGEYVTADEGKGSSIQEATECISAESGWNSDWDISQEIGSSVEVRTSGHQPGVVSTIDEGISYHISYSVVDTAITAEETEGRQEEVDTSHQSWSASVFQIVGAAPASTSPEAVEAAVRISDRNSNIDSQKCPICLASFAAQEIGTPDSCDHLFCVRCLEEWSATSNTCPLDREQFNVILVRQYPDREVTRRIFLRPRWHEIGHEDLLQPDLLFCVICFNSDVEDTTLFCFGCGLFYHLQCLRHLMHTIPDSEWFCPFCIAISLASEARSEDLLR